MSNKKEYLKVSVPYTDNYYLINTENLAFFKLSDYILQFYFKDNDTLGLYILEDTNTERFEKIIEQQLSACLSPDRFAEVMLETKLRK